MEKTLAGYVSRDLALRRQRSSIRVRCVACGQLFNVPSLKPVRIGDVKLAPRCVRCDSLNLRPVRREAVPA